ncbi:mucin-2-like isoform X2 [Eurosta solidaginis]|uniref:mucin-2-like isoform X2 n=1 Tax=Eurosta solidaginis TaxID=178769 RepID=UPI003530A3F5
MGLSRGFSMVPLWYLACFCFIIQTAINVQAQSQQQQKRSSSSRITSSRSFGTNVKTSGSNGIDFDCPEEFGYYPHPTDCTQYYVCVFGGALLESCTGGLMYSHELQTCDWPRNVGCELVDNSAADALTSNAAGTRSAKQQQQSINSQHVPSRIRFGSAFSSPAAGTTPPPKATVPPQYHRQPPQVIQAQVQSLPQHAGTLIGSRREPKPFGLQEDIAQLYVDAHDTLPPIEEEESDRQQRVYRGQPSTVSQVQRDRDGILHQASINAIPSHGKIGSYAFGSQYRDIEYQQQQPPPQQQEQPQQQQRPQQQYKPAQQQPARQQPQSTYRPLEILTTPAPLRETYKPQQQEKPTYNNNNNNQQHSLIYNTEDYDDDLIAQIEQDNVYDQPTRPPARSRVNIETLPRPTTTTTIRPIRHPIRDTHSLNKDATIYESTYDNNAEVYDDDVDVPSYAFDENERDIDAFLFDQKPPTTRFTTYAPKLIPTQESDEYNIISATRFDQELENLFKTTTKNVVDQPATTRVVTAATRNGGNTYTPTTIAQRYPTTAAATTPRTTTSTTAVTTTTTTPAPRTTARTTSTRIATQKSTTQIVHTTQPATSTKSIRSKTHANHQKYQKNQQRPKPNPTPQPKQSNVNNKNTPSVTHTQLPTTTTTQHHSQSYPNSKYDDSEETFVTVVAKPHIHKTNEQKREKLSNIPETRNTPDTSSSANSPNTPNTQNSPSKSQQAQSTFYSFRTADAIETISDASQNVRIQTAEPFRSTTTSTLVPNGKTQFFGAIDNVPDYGQLTHENTVRAISKYSVNDNGYRNSKYAEEYNGKGSKGEVKQNKRLQSYIVSDVAPQSFKPVPTAKSSAPPAVSESESEPILELLGGGESSSTLRYPTNIVYEPKPFKYNLQTSSNGFSLRAQNTEEGQPIYERKPSPAPAESETSTTHRVPSTSSASVSSAVQQVPYSVEFSEEEEIVPTTYAPPLRSSWRFGRPSSRPLQHFVLETSFEQDAANVHVSSSGSEQSLVASLKETSSSKPTTITSTTSKTTTTTPRITTSHRTTTTPRTTTTTQRITAAAPRTTTTARSSSTSTTSTTTTSTTERGQLSYTPRTLAYRDNIIKTTSNPAQRFVSPYKSLETILQEKEDRYTGSTLRGTVKPRYTNPTTPPTFMQSTSKPVRSYFLITTPQRNLSDAIFSTASTGLRNFSVSDTILNTFAPRVVPPVPSTTTTTTTTSAAAPSTETTSESTTPTTMSTVIVTAPIHIAQTAANPNLPKTQADYSYGSFNAETPRSRGRSRFTAPTVNTAAEETVTTYAPRVRYPSSASAVGYNSKISAQSEVYPKRRKLQRARIIALQGQRNTFGGATSLKPREKYENYKAEKLQQLQQQQSSASKYVQASQKTLNRKSIENEASVNDGPRAEALVRFPIDGKQDNSIESVLSAAESSSTEQGDEITDRPLKFLFSNKYRQQTKDRTLAESLHNSGYATSSTGRTKFETASLLEQLQLFLAGDSDESSAQQFVDDFSEREINAAMKEIKNLYTTPRAKVTSTLQPTTTTSSTTTTYKSPTTTTTTTLRPTTTAIPPTMAYRMASVTHSPPPTLATSTLTNSRSPLTPQNTYTQTKVPSPTLASTSSTSSTPSSSFSSSSSTLPSNSSHFSTSSTPTTSSTAKSLLNPMRASRVNNAIKSSIAAAAYSASSPSTSTSAIATQASFAVSSANSAARGNILKSSAYFANTGAAAKCSDTISNAKCNEIPSRTNTNNNRNRGSSTYTGGQERDTPTAVTSNRGTHPPRTRPTLKPSGTIVSKAQEFVDIYRYPPTRPEPLYPQPTPDKTAAKCRKDVCLLPDCACGGKDIPGDLPVETLPQIVLITFDDSVNDLNKQLYTDLFEKGRVNPNGCPITATFYVSHEWTDYSQVQNLYSDGHEMASHTISHSFGEQFSQKKWTREIAGQREILAAYGGVKLSDVRGMRAPFLSVGGNKMYKMLYDANFTYDSSLPVYENRPPSWPYTFDYKIFHDCMIPPCPTRSYPGVWQVPMVMWQDLNGGRCSMGDACSNPSESDGVYKMIMKNFERHYTTNRAPFGLYYHAAWFTQPHHKEGFIKFLDAINQMKDVWIVTNWQMLQWVRDPTPLSRINSFQPFQCDYSDRPKRCNNPKVCNLWHKSGVRYMKTCQPCPDIYPWTGKTGIRSSRIDNEIEDSTA